MLSAASSEANVDRFTKRVLFPSFLPGVSNEACDAFVRAMSTQAITATSRAGWIGSFELRPRRLGEIEVMTNVRRGPHSWTGDLLPGYESLPKSGTKQYEVFARSNKLYDDQMTSGEIARPDGVSRSGALAVLHCGGREALVTWPKGAFKSTKILFEKTNGTF